MGFRPATKREVAAVAEELGFALSDEELEVYVQAIVDSAALYRFLDQQPDDLPAVKYPRTGGTQPSKSANAHNAWYVRTEVKGANAGKLAGKRIALKDNIMLAGVPMMIGTPGYQGYIPPIDATVVARVLDAGATIVGKAHCESISGGGHTNPTGLIHNPYKRGHSPGGTSAGCAIVVSTAEADMAIGGDQGGSIRIPAANCGIVGLKPTYGLVPYTGIVPFEPTIDHAGPMTVNVADNALLLGVLAGADGIDPRQRDLKVSDYASVLDQGAAGIRVGVLREGLGGPFAEPDVDEAVTKAMQSLEALGVALRDVSIPEHLVADPVTGAIVTSGVSHNLVFNDGFGHGRQDLYVPSFMEKHRAARARADELPDSMKMVLITGAYVHRRYGLGYYAKAHNVLRRIRAAYDRAFEDVDILVMPTVPFKPRKMPKPGSPQGEIFKHAFLGVGANTAIFDHTGHPALSVPAALRDGLPIGMMLVGRHFEETTLYRLAHAFESSRNWRDW